MGKGNRHRGHDRENEYDRGDAPITQRTFGGSLSDQRHSSTLGGLMGLTKPPKPEAPKELHSQEHHERIGVAQALGKQVAAKEKALNETTPDYALYVIARRQFYDLEKKLRLNPAFVEFQKMKTEYRAASAKADEASPRCKKCNPKLSVSVAPVMPENGVSHT